MLSNVLAMVEEEEAVLDPCTGTIAIEACPIQVKAFRKPALRRQNRLGAL